MTRRSNDLLVTFLGLLIYGLVPLLGVLVVWQEYGGVLALCAGVLLLPPCWIVLILPILLPRP